MATALARRAVRVKPTSLGAKLVLILTAAAVVGALGITLLLALIITPNFNQLEESVVRDHIERTGAVLSDYGAKIEHAVRGYGDSDAGYVHMGLPPVASERVSFSPFATSNLGVQGVAYVMRDGRVVNARWLDMKTRAEQPAMRERLITAIGRIDLARVLNGRSSGYCYASIGPALAAIGVAQVRRSDGTGSPHGHIVMARVLTSAQVADVLRLDAKIVPATAAGVETTYPSRALTDVRVPVIGADGRPVAAVAYSLPREVSLLGRRVLLLAVAGSTVLLLIVLVVLRRMIGRQVLAPLHRVEAHMQRVRASGSLSPLDEDGRRDEIGSLGRSFNAMLCQLNDLREQIEAQSFALGRTESAVAVMHNVRNALTPVSTILSNGMSQLPPVDRALLDRAIAELAADDISPDRRIKLAGFVAGSAEAWMNDRETTRVQLAVGRESMAHVLEIIGQQQHCANERPPLEICDIVELIARNAIIARYSDLASIDFSFPTTATRVLANHVILSQVIGNLFGNAAEAIAARGSGSGAIAVTVEEARGDVEVRISDDGEGFDTMTGATLFQRGFSTRQHKSGGLGLHWCANSMTAMDGALRLESRGVGLGAVAVLTLRAAERRLADAA